MKKLIVVLLLITSSYSINAQHKFIKTIDDSAFGSSIRVLSTADQGWLVFSYDSLNLIRFNSCGIYVWGKKYTLPGISSVNGLNDFIKTNTGDFAFLTRIDNGTFYSPLITKLDASGNIIWSKSYEVPAADFYTYTLNTDNLGNFILYGNVNNNIGIGGITNYNVICKIDTNGTILWTRFYNHGGVWGGAIATTDGGVLARTGNTFIKTDNSGNVLWTSQFSFTATYYYLAPVEVSDGYIFTTYNSSGPQYISFCKMDLQGNLLSGGLNLERKRTDFEGLPPTLHKKSNGNIAGVFNKTISGKNYPAVVEFDKDLNIISQGSISYSQSGTTLFGKDICFLNNGIPILAGITNNTGIPFFSKMSTDYRTNCDTMLNMAITQDNISQSFIATNVSSYNLDVIEKNMLVDTFSVSQTTLCSAPPDLNFGNDTLICKNTTLTIQNKSNDVFENYLWSTGETTASITTNQPGTYWLQATYNCGTNSLSDTIQVTVKAVPDVNLGDDLLECVNTKVVFKAPLCNSCNYLWSTGSMSDSITISEQGSYWLKVENSNGCTSTDAVNVEFAKCECDFFIPNAFSPNDNGLNELFKPVHFCDFNDYYLKIYNRWGELIFLTDDKDAGWNGRFKNKLVKDDIYVYIINYTPVIKGKTRNSIQKTGTVTLIY